MGSEQGEDGELQVLPRLYERVERYLVDQLVHPQQSHGKQGSGSRIAVISPLHTVCSQLVNTRKQQELQNSSSRNISGAGGGLWLEFGVFNGTSINLMASFAASMKSSAGDMTVYGFDTFEGLPEYWREGFGQGAFDRKGELPSVRENVTLIKGLFQDTLLPFLSTRPEDEKIVIAHLDADLYSATIFVLHAIRNRVVPGTYLVFDELINYKEYRQGEWKALIEVICEFGWKIEIISQAAIMELNPVIDVWNSQQVAIRVVEI